MMLALLVVMVGLDVAALWGRFLLRQCNSGAAKKQRHPQHLSAACKYPRKIGFRSKSIILPQSVIRVKVSGMAQAPMVFRHACADKLSLLQSSFLCMPFFHERPVRPYLRSCAMTA